MHCIDVWGQELSVYMSRTKFIVKTDSMSFFVLQQTWTVTEKKAWLLE